MIDFEWKSTLEPYWSASVSSWPNLCQRYQLGQLLYIFYKIDIQIDERKYVPADLEPTTLPTFRHTFLHCPNKVSLTKNLTSSHLYWCWSSISTNLHNLTLYFKQLPNSSLLLLRFYRRKKILTWQIFSIKLQRTFYF